MASILQVFDNIVQNYNATKGLEHELHLDYHVFNGVTDLVIYDLEITRLQMQGKSIFALFSLAGR